MKKFGLLLGVLLVGVALYYAFTPHRITCAAAAHPIVGEVRVIAHTDAAIFDWSIVICWRKRGGPWILYTLDPDSAPWRKITLSIDEKSILVTCSGMPQSRIDVKSGSFEIRGAILEPRNVVYTEDPFRERMAQMVWSEGPGWKRAWEDAFGEDKSHLEPKSKTKEK